MKLNHSDDVKRLWLAGMCHVVVRETENLYNVNFWVQFRESFSCRKKLLNDIIIENVMEFYYWITLWNALQDFTDNPNRTYPTSCCAPDITDQISISHRPLASAVVSRAEDGFRERNMSEMAAEVAWNHVIPKDASRSIGSMNLNSESKIVSTCRAVFPQVRSQFYIDIHRMTFVLKLSRYSNKKQAHTLYIICTSQWNSNLFQAKHKRWLFNDNVKDQYKDY